MVIERLYNSSLALVVNEKQVTVQGIKLVPSVHIVMMLQHIQGKPLAEPPPRANKKEELIRSLFSATYHNYGNKDTIKRWNLRIKSEE